MQIQFGNWEFRPSLWPSIATLIMLPILFSLGSWQLDRADQKRRYHEDFLQSSRHPPVDLGLLHGNLTNGEEVLWRQIKSTGRFNNDVKVLLDNQVMNTVAGYFVFTLFYPEGIQQPFLVNRGWVPAGNDRSRPPEIPDIVSSVTINAAIKTAPSTGIVFKSLPPEKMSDSIYRVNRIDIDEIQALMNIELNPFVLRLLPESAAGFKRDWVVPGSGEEKHLGYAFQWFLMFVVLLLIYLRLNIRRSGVEK